MLNGNIIRESQRTVEAGESQLRIDLSSVRMCLKRMVEMASVDRSICFDLHLYKLVHKASGPYNEGLLTEAAQVSPEESDGCNHGSNEERQL
jgi:hypothetical protein